MAKKRVKFELADIAENESSFQIRPIKLSHSKLSCTMAGPKNSPYSDDVLSFHIDIPSDYPFKAPKIYPTSSIYHTNFFGFSQNDPIPIHRDWSSNHTLRILFLRVVELLTLPICSLTCCNIDNEIMQLYQKDPTKYFKECATKHKYKGTITNEVIEEWQTPSQILLDAKFNKLIQSKLSYISLMTPDVWSPKNHFYFSTPLLNEIIRTILLIHTYGRNHSNEQSISLYSIPRDLILHILREYVFDFYTFKNLQSIRIPTKEKFSMIRSYFERIKTLGISNDRLSNDSFIFCAKTLTGKEHPFLLPGDVGVFEFLEMVSLELGIPSHHTKIIYSGASMDPEQTFSFYQIDKNSPEKSCVAFQWLKSNHYFFSNHFEVLNFI